MAACLLLVSFSPPLLAKDPPPETFYYLAVPSGLEKCLFFASLQLDRHGVPAAPKKKEAKTAPFFTIWRSGYWDEKEPEPPAKNLEEWRALLALRARQTVEAKKEIAALPPPLVECFVALETLRASALHCEIVVHPLFQTQSFVGWENESHLNLLATPDGLSAPERSKGLLRTMGASKKEETQDPAQWMKNLFTASGVKVQSVRYWPEYNVFLFEAGAEFKEKMEVLFDAIVDEQSPLPRGPFYAMIAPHREP